MNFVLGKQKFCDFLGRKIFIWCKRGGKAFAGEESNDPDADAEDEDTSAQIAPITKLEEIAVSTGEEDEDVLLDLMSKLYRFDKEGNQLKERGHGNVKLLKHKETGKVRLS